MTAAGCRLDELEGLKAFLEEIPDTDRDRILYLVDGLIRDARTRQAYGTSS